MYLQLVQQPSLRVPKWKVKLRTLSILPRSSNLYLALLFLVPSIVATGRTALTCLLLNSGSNGAYSQLPSTCFPSPASFLPLHFRVFLIKRASHPCLPHSDGELPKADRGYQHFRRVVDVRTGLPPRWLRSCKSSQDTDLKLRLTSRRTTKSRTPNLQLSCVLD